MELFIHEWRMFQFQTGAIKSFNFTGIPDEFTYVSIPNWCD